MNVRHLLSPTILSVGLALAGCASPYHADRGALFGGVTGAGLGTAVGAATGEPLAGAAIGGVAGTMTGAAVGGAMDNIEARNQAAIAAQLGRPAPRGAVTITDVVSMTQSGVRDDVIATHVRNHGMARQLTTQDIIYLQQSGVSPTVVQTMQSAPPPARPVAGPPPRPVRPPERPVVVVDPYHHDHHFHHHWGHHSGHHRPGFSWGVSVSSDDF